MDGKPFDDRQREVPNRPRIPSHRREFTPTSNTENIRSTDPRIAGPHALNEWAGTQGIFGTGGSFPQHRDTLPRDTAIRSTSSNMITEVGESSSNRQDAIPTERHAELQRLIEENWHRIPEEVRYRFMNQPGVYLWHTEQDLLQCTPGQREARYRQIQQLLEPHSQDMQNTIPPVIRADLWRLVRANWHRVPEETRYQYHNRQDIYLQYLEQQWLGYSPERRVIEHERIRQHLAQQQQD
jgi:hypothetical protein